MKKKVQYAPGEKLGKEIQNRVRLGRSRGKCAREMADRYVSMCRQELPFFMAGEWSLIRCVLGTRCEWEPDEICDAISRAVRVDGILESGAEAKSWNVYAVDFLGRLGSLSFVERVAVLDRYEQGNGV